jgi:hypothetical protein
MTEEKTKTYHIEFKNGAEKRITVPADWKVTFGPCVAGGNSNGKMEMPLALRFYESKENQRAIFTDVRSFRDMDIKILEKKVSIQEEQGFIERGGKKKATTFQAQCVEWKDADDTENDNFDLLPEPSAFDDCNISKQVPEGEY